MEIQINTPAKFNVNCYDRKEDPSIPSASLTSAVKGRIGGGRAKVLPDQSYDRVRHVPSDFGTALITGRQQWHNN